MHSDSNGRFIRLLFALLASGLVHVLVIVLPYFGKTNGGEVTIDFGAKPQTHGLKVTLNYLTQVIPATHATSSAAQEVEPIMEPARAEDDPNVRTPLAVYYPTNELTAKPVPLGEPALDPAEIAAISASGTVVLVLRIDEAGIVVDAAVESSDLPDRFPEIAQKAFRDLRFVPGEINGKKVGALMRIEVQYDTDVGYKP